MRIQFHRRAGAVEQDFLEDLAPDVLVDLEVHEAVLPFVPDTVDAEVLGVV